MNYKIIPVEKFKKEAKRLIKKYPSLKIELAQLAEILEKQPATGTSLGNEMYKIRISMSSKGKGKSGGARIITYLINPAKEIFLLTIYDKSEIDAVDDRTLRRIVAAIKSEK